MINIQKHIISEAFEQLSKSAKLNESKLTESKLTEKILDKDVYTIGIYGDEIPGFNSVRQFIEYLERKGLKIHDFDGDMDYGWDITVSGPARILYNEINNKIPGYHSASIDDFFDEYSLDEFDESLKESKLTESYTILKFKTLGNKFFYDIGDAITRKRIAVNGKYHKYDSYKEAVRWLKSFIKNGDLEDDGSLEELDESKLTEAPMDVKDYAAKLRARKAEKGQNPLEKINSQIDPDMSITDQLQVYFDELVPASGPAKTIAGELVRAIMRILYRDYNDGDLWYTGYGKETCGDSVVYLIEHIEDLQDLFEDMIYKEMEDAEYTDALEDVASRVMVYLNEHPELFTTPLDKDSRSGADLESYFDLPTYEFEPDTSYDEDYYDASDDDIDEFIHDIVESDFRGATVNRWASDAWTIEGLDKEQLEQLEDVWEKWFNDFLSQYEREEEPEEDYEDEDETAEADWDDSTDSEFDESLSLSKLHYRQLAHDPSTDPDTLAELAKDKDTRLAVAKNPSTSFETLLKLSKSRDPEVKKAALAGLDSYYFQITGNDDDEFGWTDADFDESLKEKIDDDRFKRSMLTQKIFYEYPDISEDDEDYLNSLSYDALVKECKNRGWEDLLKDFDESLNKDNQKRGRKMKIVAEDFQECNLNKMGTNEYEANTNRQKHINMYRKFANLNDDEVITEDMIDDLALTKTATYCNREPDRIKAEILGQRYSEYEQ